MFYDQNVNSRLEKMKGVNESTVVSLAKYSRLFDSDSVLFVFVKTVVGNGFVA